MIIVFTANYPPPAMLTLRNTQLITPMPEKSVAKHKRYRVIEGRFVPGEWSVEMLNKEGGYEAVMFFRGPEAREQAIVYGRGRFGEFEEINA